MQVTETTLLCAFDYAVGRSTYVVPEVTKDILQVADTLTDNAKFYMIKELNRRYSVNALGMEQDKKEWLKVLDALKGGTNA